MRAQTQWRRQVQIVRPRPVHDTVQGDIDEIGAKAGHGGADCLAEELPPEEHTEDHRQDNRRGQGPVRGAAKLDDEGEWRPAPLLHPLRDWRVHRERGGGVGGHREEGERERAHQPERCQQRQPPARPAPLHRSRCVVPDRVPCMPWRETHLARRRVVCCHLAHLLPIL
jgi:hypothetical protein